jgi:hypothetical protein
MECRNVSDLTLNQAIDNIYASINNDNEDLDILARQPFIYHMSGFSA